MNAKVQSPFINKSHLTNVFAALIVGTSVFVTDPKIREVVANVGFFALSGALTNWIAVHMLFEKVPGFYGSGVIQTRFEELKSAIKALIKDQFFTRDYITALVAKQKKGFLSHSPKLAQAIDYDAMFKGLVEAIMGSSFGSMLQMVGGEKALVPLQPKFEEKMQEVIQSRLACPDFQQKLNQSFADEEMIESLLASLEEILDDRLKQMTPKMVKKMMKDIMHQHLGWLVVWGGVFGGALGLVKSLIFLW